MDRAAKPRWLLHDANGAVMVEFALVALPLFLLIFGVVEFSYFMHRYSLASKSVHDGLRLAIVSDPVDASLSGFRQSDIGASPGGVMPIDSIEERVCRSSEAGVGTCTEGVFDEAAFLLIFNRMKSRAGFLSPDNVVISYRMTGLGYINDLSGMRPLITIQLVDVSHPVLLLGLLRESSLPDLGMSLSTEDLSSSWD